MLNIIGKAGRELQGIFQTGSALVCQGCNHLLDTSIGKKVSAVTAPIFRGLSWVKERTPEISKSFVYGAVTGAVTVLATRIMLWRRNDTINHHLNRAADIAERNGANGHRDAIRAQIRP